MRYAQPALIAATLAAASLAPVQAQAPTSMSSKRIALSPRLAAGLVEMPAEVVAAAPVKAGPEAVPVPASAVVPAALQVAVPLVVEKPPATPAPPVLVAQAGEARPMARPARPAPAPAPAAPAAGSNANALRPCSSVLVDPPTRLTLGKSEVVRLPFPVSRLIVGGQAGSRAGRPAGAPGSGAAPGVPAPPAQREQPAPPSDRNADGVAETDVTLLSPTELFFLGRHPGSMNVVLQGNDGRCLVKDLVVTVDPGTLQAQLAELIPEETGIKVRAAENALVLTGSVSDSVKLDQVLSLAGSYSDPKKLVNLLRVTAPQQVMLEVKIAEVSKTLLDRFGLDFTRVVTNAAGTRTSIISGIFGGAPAILGRFGPNTAAGVVNGNAVGIVDSDSAAAVAQIGTTGRGATLLGGDMQKRDGVIRVLAEPNIMAISGQAASFLSGGKIFIPVAQSPANGGGMIVTLEEKEFGVGLKFTPTVLDGRINLKVTSEVSELSQTGTPFTTVGGVTAVLPSLSTRKVDTTVQLGDGQSFAVAGLIKNNVTEALDKFPGLGEVPVVGALFRSTEFQNDRTELLFVITPRLVKPVVGPVTLPTDNHVVPSRGEVIFNGMGEGSDPAPVPQPQLPQPTALPPAAPPARP